MIDAAPTTTRHQPAYVRISLQISDPSSTTKTALHLERAPGRWSLTANLPRAAAAAICAILLTSHPWAQSAAAWLLAHFGGG